MTVKTSRPKYAWWARRDPFNFLEDSAPMSNRLLASYDYERLLIMELLNPLALALMSGQCGRKLKRRKTNEANFEKAGKKSRKKFSS